MIGELGKSPQETGGGGVGATGSFVKPDGRSDSEYEGQSIDVPHPLSGPLEEKRSQAASLHTIYVYDFLDLLEEAVKKQWRNCPRYFLPRGHDAHQQSSMHPGTPSTPTSASTPLPGPAEYFNWEWGSTSHPTAGSETATPHQPHHPSHRTPSSSYTPAYSYSFLPERVLEAVELILDGDGELIEVEGRPKGCNTCGMVAWKVTMSTPEFPKGRRLIVIGNDVTFQMGTFGVQEDLLYQRASEVARSLGIPRVYIAVNSGARMGLATEVQRCFRVEWIDAENPTLGFKYLYLTEKDYRALKASDSVVAEAVPILHPTEGRVYRITDVIGAQLGLGVENLCGSGAIAGETSRAYRHNMTITFVTGRTVGIGAYITRLGQRVIQKQAGAPILLTGYQALNRLIGRDVYTSNDEIGGVDVMFKNGVSHVTVKNDMQGCEAIVDWLSYTPEHRGGPLPIMMDPSEPINRAVVYKPTSSTEDPRLMVTGTTDSKGGWQGGIFDRGSFRETMADWAKSVVCGRARLGGIPVGVICVETRVTESAQPADPAMPHTSEVKLTRAGQVWFPDSAYKTAQAIWDMNAEELPLMIFANWRGFSGGQRDMFNEVLKFGSFIVDALVEYRQPCFVYIPPKAELRGGAWVVVDPRINPQYMEMYADPDCRGGVLEPVGTVEIKFREKSLIETAYRLDPLLCKLKAQDAALVAEDIAMDSPLRQEIKEKRDRRLQELLPVYKQVAVHFADLHDTPVRMKKKNAIHDIVAWDRCRYYFYWRLRRQLIMLNLRSELTKTNPFLSLTAAERLICNWAEESGHNANSNYQFVLWACHSIHEISRRLTQSRHDYVHAKVTEFCGESMSSVCEALFGANPGLAKIMDDASKPATRETTSELTSQNDN
eukprot:GHVN01012978.1.p1 GENE.GHVN01012978.1~~GHVN01012978.1.p1  ORF type:complete len:1003 (+),score=153.41 GHVN01012978.1:353-3010(+)